MTKLVSGLCTLALLAGAAAGRTDSGQGGRIGQRSTSDRTPAASPSTSPSDGSSGSPAPGSVETPSTPSSPGAPGSAGR